MSWRPRLATVLVLITLVIGLLPLGGLFAMRIYESALVRQTESELLAQGALIAAIYRQEFDSLTGGPKPDVPMPRDYGNPVTSPPRPGEPENRWRPRYAVLDLADDPILAAPEDAQPVAARAAAGCRASASRSRTRRSARGALPRGAARTARAPRRWSRR